MTLKSTLQHLKPLGYAATAYGRRLQSTLGMHGVGPPVGIVIERADWAIRWWGTYTSEEANKLVPGISSVTTDPATLTRGVVEFGSQYQWVEWSRFLSPRCRRVTTFFHGKPEDGPEVARHVDRFLASVPQLDRIVASASIVRDRLIGWDVPPEKISQIPIGCETWRFVAPTDEQRQTTRMHFGVPKDHICVGSFQKDGEGWGSGVVAKPIKGPDVFLGAIDILRKDMPIFVLLTGPARGFVKAGLEKMNVPFAHHYAEDRDDLARCYHALDIYLITSREEGGPMALMESMSSSVPVVSTSVGMAPDLILDGVTGELVAAADANLIAERARELLAMGERLDAIKRAARSAVLQTDWSVVGRRHLEEIWRPLIELGDVR